MNRLLTDTERRQFRFITEKVRRSYSYWDIDGLLELQDTKTLEAVGEWLANLTISGNAIANELRIVEAISYFKQGKMPEEIE